jgi:hypothetical protein
MMEIGWAMGRFLKKLAATMPPAKPHGNVAGLRRKFAMAKCSTDFVAKDGFRRNGS